MSGTDDADDGQPPWARNRLDEEASPYLQQHADNPVNWQPWDETAREAARERDVPIFLSIGYAACHWCHVMEEESFADPSIAAQLNEDFLPVKVDREERPDVDTVYMTVSQLVTGRGGWPLSVFLTPDGKPFYVGTYFPAESTQRGQPGFRRLLDDVADAWADPEERAEIEERAEQWTAAAKQELESVDGEADHGDTADDPAAADASSPLHPQSIDGHADDGGLLVEAAEAAVDAADREFGGFGTGQKFPHPGRIHLLLRAHDRTGRADFRAVAVETLDAMATGGLYDHLGGGFHRYTTDREWVVPHFEKMLYDNAELPRAFLAGYQVTGDERYATVARETFAFLDRELSHPDGGFYSTLDARSPPPESWSDGEDAAAAHPGGAAAAAAGAPAGDGADEGHGEEGAFYLWRPEELWRVADEQLDADLFCDRYAVDEQGDVEGRSVLTVHGGIDELAEAHDLPADEVVERLDALEDRLRAVRADRPRPPRDEKVIAGWNGLAIHALADAARVLQDDAYADRAVDALGFVREHLWDADERRLARRYKEVGDGTADVTGQGYLEDYAYLARGALALHGVTAEPDHLAFALELADAIVEAFWDADDATLYFTPAGGEDLIARPQSLEDSSTPSSTGVAADVLLALDAFRTDDRLADVATRTLASHARTVQQAPLPHVSQVLASDAQAAGHLELTVVDDLADGLPPALRATLAGTYLPGLVLAPRPAADELLSTWLDALPGATASDDAPPIWAGRGRADEAANEVADGTANGAADATADAEGPTHYVCRRACSPPLTDADEIAEWVAELTPGSD